MFYAQSFRKFVLGLGFIRPTREASLSFFVVLVDRAGVVYTNTSRVDGYSGLELARILFGLAYARHKTLGVDDKMTIDHPVGKVTSITVDGQEFHVVAEIHSSPSLFSRGTRVFVVRDTHGALHILKDSWVLVSQNVPESDFVKKISKTAEGLDNERFKRLCPKVIAADNFLDSTDTPRGRLAKKSCTRIHRRIVTGPIGDPLTSFRSRQEFVQVILDTVNCKLLPFLCSFANGRAVLEFLDEKCNIIHGDISLNNIVIFRSLPNRSTASDVTSTASTSVIQPSSSPNIV